MATFPTEFNSVRFVIFDEENIVGHDVVMSGWAMTETEIRDLGSYFLGLQQAMPGLSGVELIGIYVDGVQGSVSLTA